MRRNKAKTKTAFHPIYLKLRILMYERGGTVVSTKMIVHLYLLMCL